MRPALPLLVVLCLFRPGPACGQGSDRLRALLEAEWQRALRDRPTEASRLNFRAHPTDWPDLSPEALARREKRDQEVLRELRAIDPDRLPEPDRLHYVLFRKHFETEVEGASLPYLRVGTYDWHLAPIDQLWGIQNPGFLIDTLRFDARRDYDDWLARLEKFPAHVDQMLALLKEGIRAGVAQPKPVVRRVLRQASALVVDDPERSAYFAPFRRFPPAVPAAERARLTRRARDRITREVTPACKKFADYLETEYLPACPDQGGIGRLRGGEAVYAYLVRRYTTTDLTPDRVHEVGLAEVERITTEMKKIVAEVGFKGTLAEFVLDLRENPRYAFKTREAGLTACRDVCRRVERQLPLLFGKLPRTRLSVEWMPAATAADAPAGYYRGGSLDGRFPGTFFVNPTTLRRPGVEALVLHEAIPGHHLQTSLAVERSGVPNFLRFTSVSGISYEAYVEGWGLYCEGLGAELGLYRDPESRFGRLSLDMLRAVRLVVDTGMHAKGWTRDKALAYALEHCAESRTALENEIDRYLALPGQALAYKIGELKIRELRAGAVRALGDRFESRAFHDAVLSAGPLPLDVLEARVKAWAARTGGR